MTKADLFLERATTFLSDNSLPTDKITLYKPEQYESFGISKILVKWPGKMASSDALFSLIEVKRKVALITATLAFYRKVLNLNIPLSSIQHAQEQNITYNPFQRRQSELQMLDQGLPCAVLSFCREKRTDQELCSLTFVRGMSPQTALEEFQSTIRMQRNRIN